MSQPATTSSEAAEARLPRKTEIGFVTSAKMTKTRRIEIERLVPHPK